MYIPLGYFRFLLAISVFFAHTSDAFKFLNVSLNWAGIGVWLFYVVSGYIIFSAHDLFYNKKAWGFLKNRILRIYPSMWLCLVILIIILYSTGKSSLYNNEISIENYDFKEIILSFSIIGGFLSSNAWSPLPQGFTTTIEMQFYLVAFALFLTVTRFSERKELVFFIAGLGCLVSYLLIELTGTQYRFFGALRFSTLFVFGASIFFANKAAYKGKWSNFLLNTSFVFSIHFVLSTGSSSGYTGFSLTEIRVKSAVLIAFLMGVLIWSTNISVQGRLKSADKVLGDLTYPFYLIQTPILALILEYYPLHDFLDWLALFVICLAASAVINLGFERRFLSMRKRIRGKAL